MGPKTTGASMELANLVHAVKRRPLATFALLGSLMFAAKTWLVPTTPEPQQLTVTVERGATPAEVARARDEAILLAIAENAGVVQRDRVVRDRLVQNMRFAAGELTDGDALAQAVALGMQRTDPVARGRLIQIAETMLAESTRPSPSDKELEAYLQSHADRYRRAPTVSFEQVFVSRKRADFDERLRAIAARPDDAESDAGLLPRRIENGTEARIDVRFGPGFGARVMALDSDDWSPPIRSKFGAHFVRVLSRDPGTLPALKQVRARVVHDYQRDARAVRVQEALARARTAFAIHIEDQS